MKNIVSKNLREGNKRRSGFTLIELLVVIAIISILAAIIFPVFSTVEENARQNNTMAHLHDVSAGLALYKLDNKTYPPVLFAYACQTGSSDTCNPADTMATIGSDGKAKNELVGLYPEYVKDYHEFICADDNVDDPNGKIIISSSTIQPNYLTVSGSLVGADGSANYPDRAYFQDDAFDVGPRVADTNKVYDETASNSYIIRYQTSWTGFCTNFDATNPNAAPCDLDYLRQLRWTNPPANTYVTGVSYHVPASNKLIVLYAGGNALKVNFQAGTPPDGWDDTNSSIAPQTTSVSYTDSTGASQSESVASSAADFWKFNPTP